MDAVDEKLRQQPVARSFFMRDDIVKYGYDAWITGASYYSLDKAQ